MIMATCPSTLGTFYVLHLAAAIGQTGSSW